MAVYTFSDTMVIRMRLGLGAAVLALLACGFLEAQEQVIQDPGGLQGPSGPPSFAEEFLKAIAELDPAGEDAPYAPGTVVFGSIEIRSGVGQRQTELHEWTDAVLEADDPLELVNPPGAMIREALLEAFLLDFLDHGSSD